jgi:hypothetical protein
MMKFVQVVELILDTTIIIEHISNYATLGMKAVQSGGV